MKWKSLIVVLLGLLVLGATAGAASAEYIPIQKQEITKDTLKQIVTRYSMLRLQDRTKEADILLEKYGFVKLGEHRKTFRVSSREFSRTIIDNSKIKGASVSLPTPNTWVSQRDLTLTIEYLLQPEYATLFIDYYWEWTLTENLFDRGDLDVISITNVVGKVNRDLLVKPEDVRGGQLVSGSAFGNHEVVKKYDNPVVDWNTEVIEHQIAFKVGDQIKKGVIHIMYDVNTKYLIGRGGAITAHFTYAHTFGNRWLSGVISKPAGIIAGGATSVILEDPLAGTVVSSAVTFATDRAVSWALEHFGVVRGGTWAADPVNAYISLPDYWPSDALSVPGGVWE